MEFEKKWEFGICFIGGAYSFKEFDRIEDAIKEKNKLVKKINLGKIFEWSPDEHILQFINPINVVVVKIIKW